MVATSAERKASGSEGFIYLWPFAAKGGPSACRGKAVFVTIKFTEGNVRAALEGKGIAKLQINGLAPLAGLYEI